METSGLEIVPVRGVRVVVADDQPVARVGLTTMLKDTDKIEVMAETDNAHTAVRDTLALRPDVLVLDLPRHRGAVIRDVLLGAPETNTLVFSAADDDDSLLTALRAGACGYLLKKAATSQIVRAIERVAAGEAVFSPGVAARANALLTGTLEHPFPELTTREREVLSLVAAGMPNPAIARELRLVPKTVSNHLSNIYAKLGLADRYQAILRARDAGLGRQAAGY
jgi:DNA-binding NarL/FixJ family response regulator